jgi:16S rRNA (cytidine1402-2'-O)-methyltransferase
MTTQRAEIQPGLHLVATPIGAARDITLRALDILASAEVLAAEDTRSLRRLMEIHGVALGGRPLLAYHDHNGPQMRPRILGELHAGRSVAYASEAGTPLVADPGYQLARAVIDAGLPVFAAPGPSAVLAALTVSGLPTDRFAFLGFAPPRKAQRLRFLEMAAKIPATLIFYESPRRVSRMLGEMLPVFGPRPAAVCRELTKRFEEVRRGSLEELARHYAEHPIKGEVVLVIGRAEAAAADPAGRLDQMLVEALAEASLKDAVARVAEETGLPRREVYQAALRLGNDGT